MIAGAAPAEGGVRRAVRIDRARHFIAPEPARAARRPAGGGAPRSNFEVQELIHNHNHNHNSLKINDYT